MSRLQSLKVLIYERLSAAVEEIIGHLETTITEYEEEAGCRCRQLLAAGSKPEDQLQIAVFPANLQQPLLVKEGPQVWGPRLDQEDTECLHIKEEKEDLWTGQEGEQLQGLHEEVMTKFPFTHVLVKSEADEETLQSSERHQRQNEENRKATESTLGQLAETSGQRHGLHEEVMTKFPFTHVPVKSEADEETLQSSERHQRQNEENREAEPAASSSTEQIKTEADGEDCRGSEQDRISISCFKSLSGSDDNTSHSSKAVTEYSREDWKETQKPQTDLNIMTTNIPVNHTGHNTGNKSFGCSKCGKKFGRKHHLQTHMRCHTGEKPFSCSLCGKRFTRKGHLTQHLTVHTREKPCSCPVCGERFAQKGNLTQHMTVHTREKLCW